jgi:FkbM family methyltransferase
MNPNIFDEFPQRDSTAVSQSSDEVFEWVALLESVAAAKSRFIMLELGAGYGRWTARAASALRYKHPGMPMQFIAVEAEPAHFARLRKYLTACDINLDDCSLVEAPVSGRRETVHFTIGHAEEWWGQAILPSADCGFGDWPNAKVVTMQTVTIPDLIRDIDYVDLIDMDIQGAELACVESAVEELSRKVKRMFVATHSDDIHDRIRGILGDAGGWRIHADYPLQRTHQTPFGTINFRDGAQYWENLRVAPREPQL